MMTSRLLLFTLLLLCLGETPAWPAQPTKAERERFAETKAQADRGDAEAQLRLGSLYSSGTGVARDPAKAAKWHRKAAEQGLARAQYQLAEDYTAGFGVKPDSEEAFAWFERAAQQGLVESELAVGLCYLSGSGVDENGAEAVKWFRQAAAKDSSAAKYELGLCYCAGTGVTKDLEDGVKWIRAAAEEGFAAAQNRLGQFYAKGEGVSRQYIEAYKWFILAAAQDDEHALDIRVSIAGIEGSMTPEQIAQAQLLAHEFKPRQKSDVPASLASAPAASRPVAVATSTNSPSNPAVTAPELQAGFLNVKADDESSEVYVDGTFVGNPPARLKLAVGAHLVEVKKPGFKDYRSHITVGAGSDLTLKAVLEKR